MQAKHCRQLGLLASRPLRDWCLLPLSLQREKPLLIIRVMYRYRIVARTEQLTARTNYQMSTCASSTCRCCQPTLLREAEAIGGGAHARKRRVAGHVRALLSRADATTQVVLLSAVTMQQSGGSCCRRTSHITQCFIMDALKSLCTTMLRPCSMLVLPFTVLLGACLYGPSRLCSRG